MSKFEEIISDQKPEPISFSSKCLGCPRVQEKIQDIDALRILQQENIDIATAIMDDAEREKMAREVAPMYAQVQGIPLEQLEELVEAIKQDYPQMIDNILSSIGAEEQAIREAIIANTTVCDKGPHTLIAFDDNGEISASGNLCDLDVSSSRNKGEKLVTAIIYREVQIDNN